MTPLLSDSLASPAFVRARSRAAGLLRASKIGAATMNRIRHLFSRSFASLSVGCLDYDPDRDPECRDAELLLVGVVSAGFLAEAVQFDGLGQVDGLHLLKVSGDSMIEAGIRDGDHILVKPADSAESGQIVVALTDDGEATLKFWWPEPRRGRIRLEPANESMSPIYVRQARVQAVLVGVVRQSEPARYHATLMRVDLPWRPRTWRDCPPLGKAVSRASFTTRDDAEEYRRRFNRAAMKKPRGLWVTVEERVA